METLTKQWTQGKTPGQVLDEMRRDRAWEIAHLTQALGIQEWETVCLLADETPIDFAMAGRLANAFQTTAQFWLCLQAVHEMRTGSVILTEAEDFVTVAPQPTDAEALNKRLISALAGMCYERLSLGCEMSPGSFFDETALNLLRDIGVVVQLDETEYEFTPGFDPELGEWT
jgi:plasmid maintenance system antidote protein VapI